jgi:hypothetical protein
MCLSTEYGSQSYTPHFFFLPASATIAVCVPFDYASFTPKIVHIKVERFPV